jgi:transglutaminase-like putative cysteine protease
MSWRIAISHSTTHRYEQEVFHSYNEARLVPQTEPGQVCLETRIDVVPRAKVSRFRDYWGSIVDSFDIHTPHAALRVESHSNVETSSFRPAEPSLTWEDLQSEAVTEQFAELLAPTKLVPTFVQEAAEIRSLGPADPAAAARAAADWVSERLQYQSGATDVTTPADGALKRGKGVCQDFAHLTLGVLRSLGIPGRYVSGYLHPREDAEVGETVEGQGHAWIEWWSGTWIPWDPTHAQPPGLRHVSVGRGRDYSDVPPLKGIYQGAPSIAHEVAVAITRTA